MAEKTRQAKRYEHFDRQDRAEGELRGKQREVGLQESEFDEAQHDRRGVAGLEQDDISYPCVEIVPNAIILYMCDGKGMYLQAEEGMLLSELLAEASAECLFCEMDS